MTVTAASVQSAYQSAFMQKTSVSVSASYLEITGGALSQADAGDSLDVSDIAKKYLDRAKDLDIFKIIYPNGDVGRKHKTLDEIAGEFKSDFMDFASSFNSLFKFLDTGVKGIVMGLNGTGGVNVEGGGGIGQQVQGLFDKSETTVSRFAVMAARAALVDARGTIAGFESDYADDPVAAIKANIDALKERLLGFRAVAGSEGMSYGFVREFSATIEYSSTTVSWASTAAAAGEAA